MTNVEKEDLIRRLEARFQESPAPVSGVDRDLHNALQRMVHAGACRFGVCADKPEEAGFSACDLAPPLARIIDHTALKPETTEAQIRALCEEARRYCFASVCVNPCYVPLATTLLRGTPTAVCTVIGFPLGATHTEAKVREAALAIQDGATELDMVINIGKLKSGHYDYVEQDIRGVVQAAQAGSRTANGRILVKVILETALLTNEEKVIASVLTQNAGADFVKTSTGFSKHGATTEDVLLMRRVVGDRMGVKAAGGVRSREDAEAFVAHGATRLGASASVQIMQGLVAEGTY